MFSYTHGFPNPLASAKEKKSLEYGRSYALAIWSKWHNQLSSRNFNIKKLRDYAIGDQDIKDCQKNISGEYTNLSYWEVDWNDKLNLLPILLRNFSNNVNFDELQPVVKAIDPSALESKTKRKDEKIKMFLGKDIAYQLAEMNGGESPVPLEDIPQSMEQIELEEQISEPLKIEKAETLVLEAIAVDNLFHLIQKEVLEEMLITNYGIARIDSCPVRGVTIQKVKIENFVHGESSNSYFSDCPYYGEIKNITINQVKNIAKRNGVHLDESKIRKLFGYNNGQELRGNETVSALFYAFKTNIEETFVIKRKYSKKAQKKTNAIKFISKDDYKEADNEKTQLLHENYDVWFEGIMLLDSEHTIIKHQLMKNMAEDKSTGKLLPPFIVIKPREKSIVEECIPRINSLQELRYRILHFRNTLKGPITNIDPDRIANIVIGNQRLTPLEVLSLYFTKGIRFVKSIDEDGDPINTGFNVAESDSPIPRALIELSSQFITEVQLLNQTFGAIQYDQASPDPKTLMPTESYRLTNNTALRDYTNALYEWTIMCYQTMSARVNDVFKWKNVREKFIRALGSDDMEVIEAFKKERGNHYFGIYTDLIPTAEEKANLQRRLESYVQQGIITPLDEMKIMNTRNRIQALSLLNLVIMANEKKAAQIAQQQEQSRINANAQAAIISQEEKRKTLQMEYEYKKEIAEKEFERKAFLQEQQGKLQLMIEEIKAEGKKMAQEYTEDFQERMAMMKKEKDEETRLKAINESKKLESKLIDQRKGKTSGIYDDSEISSEINLEQIIKK